MRSGMFVLAAAAILALGAPGFVAAAQLAGVRGLSPALVASIQQKRPFRNTAEFNAHLLAGGLSAEQAQAVYPQLFLPIRLNSSTAEEIALIPGMSRRMVREFLEYRPYENLEEFNREIGKYVDANEVARLRSYVTLN